MLGMKRNPTSVVGQSAAAMRQSSLGIQSARKRQSLIGAASSHGRLFKVLGDFFTLLGERKMQPSGACN
jgi:hypothetical protein